MVASGFRPSPDFSAPRRTEALLATFLAAIALGLGPIAVTALAQAPSAPRTAPFPTLESQSSFAPIVAPRPKPWPTAAERRKDYEEDARALGQVLGAAHYLRWLCYGRRDQVWREFMGQLLDREDQRLRAGMAEAFNKGFDGERLRFDRCTERAIAAEVDWKAKGLKLADSLAARNRD
jgi:uncharacterized protein (TIGR02301 family)